MKVRDICSREVVTIEPDATLREASGLMRGKHVGALVVVEPAQGGLRPVGIITDRDIIVAAIAVAGARPEGLRVRDAMSSQLASARLEEGVFDAVQTMTQQGVRRLPVVAEDGTLRGIVTADDVNHAVSTKMARLATALRQGPERELLETVTQRRMT